MFLNLNKRKFTVVLACLFNGLAAHAQDDSVLPDPFSEPRSLTYGIWNRQTSLLDDRSTIYGLFVGVQHGKRMKHVFTVNSNVFWSGVPEEREVQLNFVGFAEEYSFLFIDRFEFILHTHAGLGEARFRSPSGSSNALRRDFIVPFEFGIHSTYHVNDWLKVTFGAGNRSVLFYGSNELNGGYWKLGVGVDLAEFLAVYSKGN